MPVIRLETATKCTDCVNPVAHTHPDEKERAYPCDGCGTAICYTCYNKIGMCLACEGC